MERQTPKTLGDLRVQEDGVYVWPNLEAVRAAQSARKDLCLVCASCDNLGENQISSNGETLMREVERKYMSNKENPDTELAVLCVGFVVLIKEMTG